MKQNNLECLSIMKTKQIISLNINNLEEKDFFPIKKP
jgi:hypothetical protein